MAVQPTWVQVAKRKTSPAFLPTECTVNLEQFAAPLRISPSSSRYSAFVPLPSTYKQGWALEIVSNIPNSAVGIVPRADISLIEVCFTNHEVQQDFLSSPFVCKHFTSNPVLPAGTPSQYLPIKLVNVPVLASLVIESQLRSLWSAHSEVVAIAPHIYKGTLLQSNRWDLVLKLLAGTTLSATPFFDLLGFKVMASWPGSDKACPRCKLIGHDSRSCPRRPASKASKKRNSTPATRTTPPAPTKSSSVDAVDTVTAAVAAPTSDPSTSTTAVISTSDTSADIDMTDASTSATISTPSPSPISSASGPTRMYQKDLLYLSPNQLKSLTQAVAPKHVDFEVYMKLSGEQQDAMPTFINIRSAGKPVAPSLRRTCSKDRDKK